MAEQKAEKETVKMVYKNGRIELYIHELFGQDMNGNTRSLK